MRNNGLFKEQHGTSAPMIYEGRQKQFDYLVRRDRLLGTTTLLSEERREGYRKPGVSATIDIKPEEECTFCCYRETTPMDSELDPSGRLHHKNGAVTVRNAFGYGKRDYVTILPPIYEDENGKTEHLVLLSQLDFEHLEAVLETLYDLALRVEDIRKKDPSIVSMRTFVNWGPNAGGSKQHPHLQNLLTEEFSPTAVSREIEVCDRYLENTGTNMFDAYIDSTRKNGSRVVYDGDDIFICTPFAPRYEDETLVIPKRPIAHILQTTEADRKKLVRPSLGVFGANFYYFVRGDVNIGIHMAPFGSPAGLDQAAESYRMHFHIIPRRNPASSHGVAREGGSEIMFEDYAVGKFPEDSAAGFREWYRPGGPNPDLVPPALRDQFERHVLRHQPAEIF